MNPAAPVLLFSRTLDIGGCERDLTKIALGLDRCRFEPHVGCFYDDGCRADELKAAGIPVACFPVRSFRSVSVLAEAIRLRRYLCLHNIQLIHTFDAPTNIFAGPIARCSGLRGVIGSNLWYRQMLDSRAMLLSRLVDRFFDRIVVNSEAVQKHLIADEDIPERSTFLCRNGVDTREFHARGRAKLQFLNSVPLVIGTVCALRDEKRLDLLLAAYASIRPLLPGLKLLIIGSGPMLTELQSLTNDLAVSADTIFVPAQASVAPYLRSIDVFVLTSSSESLPNALLEAMACGCCVIGSRIGGIPEAIANGQNGLTFTCGDVGDLTSVLSHAVRNSSMRERLAAAAAADIPARFSIKTTLLNIQGLYQTILAGEECNRRDR